ncbi:MAG: NAD-dependent epimerase/dehydratase family protein [Acidobacteria bacterium]|nr:MAG: NAD-dependent epimerase/dehydratase family protein [Acidobacteriota bacterium]
MKVLVTGGAGFIGSHACEHLLDRGDEIVVVDNCNDFYDPRIKARNLDNVRARGHFPFYCQDLLDRPALSEVFKTHQPSAVLHLAAYAGVRPSLENPVLYTQVNVTGTAGLLELAREFGVTNFVFASSSSVYGINSKVPFAEEDPISQPVSPYAATKRAAELLCFTHHHNHGLPISCLRFFTVYGPRQRPEMAIHKFVRTIVNDGEIPVYHQGKSERDYTYVDDVVQGILGALDRPDGFQIYNLGNSRTVPLMRLIELVETALRKKARIKLLPAQAGDVPITYADISRAREHLGYSPETPIEEGIPKFVEWYLREMV